MRHLFFILIALTSLPEIVLAENDDTNVAICMAALAYKNAWSDRPTGGQTEYGFYLGKTNFSIHKFKSYNERYMFLCDVRGNRIHTAMAPVALGNIPQINYARTDEICTYEIFENNIIIELTYYDGTIDKQKYSLNYIKKKYKK